MTYESKFGRSEPPPSVKPRRVRGGVRLIAREWPLRVGWVGSAWLDAVTSVASEEALREGFEYARSGQARGLEFEPGKIVSAVQGRSLRAYRVAIEAPVFSEDQWERIVAAMSDQAIYGAKMLAGEMPESIPELFTSLGLQLLPSAAELRCGCSAPNETPWCKHACCVAILVAEALEKRPFEIFSLRGMIPHQLFERLRDQRAEANATTPGGVMSPVSAGGAVERMPSRPLEACTDDFWAAGSALADIETPLRRPDVSHALLRRLGPSPFTDARFPLVGLLATCYDTISQSALQQDTGSPDSPDTPDTPEAPDPSTEEDESADPTPVVRAETPSRAPEAGAGGWPLGTAKRKSR